MRSLRKLAAISIGVLLLTTGMGSAQAPATPYYNCPPDCTPPVKPLIVAVSSHTDGQTVAARSVTLSGTAANDDARFPSRHVRSVTVDGTTATLTPLVAAGSVEWSASVPLVPGPNTLTVVAWDNYLVNVTPV